MHDKLAALQMLGRHLLLFRESLETPGNLVNDVDADGVREIILARLASIAARAAENDNAQGSDDRATVDDAVGLADVGSAEPDRTAG
jgi:hypothetical protein